MKTEDIKIINTSKTDIEETILGHEGGIVLQDVEELSVFHPDQLDQLADIQEELERLEAVENVGIEEVVSMNMDDSVVDHEVTIVATQEESILPDIQDDNNFLKEQVLTLPDDSFPVDVENYESQEVIEQPCSETLVLSSESIIVPSSIGTITQMMNPSSVVYTVPSGTMRVKTTASPVKKPIAITNLKNIRPIMTSKKLSTTTIGQPRNVITKVFLSNNHNQQGGQPIMFTGDSGHQTIRIVGGNATQSVAPSPTKTITLAQARQMGLLSPGKLQQIIPGQKSLMVNNSVIMNPNQKKTVTVVKTPTKILPLPATSQLQTIAPLPAVNTTSTAPQKIFIRQGSTLKTGTFTPTPGQVFRIPTSQTTSSNNQIHQIQLPGKQVQYIRLVNAISSSVPSSGTVTLSNVGTVKKQSTSTCYNTISTVTAKPVPIALSTNINTSPQLKMVPVNAVNQPQQGTPTATRVIMNQALSQLRQETSATPVVQATSLSNIVMVPAQYVQQLTSPVASSTSTPTVVQPAVSVAQSMSTPIKPKDNWVTVETPVTKPKTILLDQPNGIRPRKPCNCTKSQCLKLMSISRKMCIQGHFTFHFTFPDPSTFHLRYCDCFANGEFCFQCNCNSCFNNLEHEEDRQRAIKSCLERNPNAFRPKIGKSYVGDERRHNKGCNCKRSGCLKNYCECYEAKIPCSNNCKCVGCRNVEETKGLRELASVAEEKLMAQTSVKNSLATEVQDIAFRPHNSVTVQGPRQPFNQLLKQEIVEATCRCLLAINEKAESSEEAQCRILEEFGQCLVQIIRCAAAKQASNTTTT